MSVQRQTLSRVDGVAQQGRELAWLSKVQEEARKGVERKGESGG